MGVGGRVGRVVVVVERGWVMMGLWWLRWVLRVELCGAGAGAGGAEREEGGGGGRWRKERGVWECLQLERT